MIPILKEEKKETILISEITGEHIVAAIIDKKPCLFTKSYYEESDRGSFKSLSSDFSLGNGYSYLGGGVKSMIKYVIENNTGKVEVFHQKDWKEALQWLIDNCE